MSSTQLIVFPAPVTVVVAVTTSPSEGVALLTVRVKFMAPSAHVTVAGSAPAAPAPNVTAKPAATANALAVATVRRPDIPDMSSLPGPVGDPERAARMFVVDWSGALPRGAGSDRNRGAVDHDSITRDGDFDEEAGRPS
ncbi:hypothetical protein GCM10023094_02210 [Rhodococcus olei]|uniref:Uncharacterized protein n=1 Tax=Rhodococcus olei TaxID=2161675 RepID=A0ABP8NQZ1_9NOCA